MKVRIMVIFFGVIPFISPVRSQSLFSDLDKPVSIQFGGLPENLTSARSAVIIKIDNLEREYQIRNQWESYAQKVHSKIIKMSIDPICYIHYDDWNSGPMIKKAYTEEMIERGVENIILASTTKVGLEDFNKIQIFKFNQSTSLIANNETLWAMESPSLEKIMLRLGRQILSQGLERKNFLIPEEPYILKDLPVFNGIQLSNYPGQLRRATLGVVAPIKITTPVNSSEELQAAIENYNSEIEDEINEMKLILSNYPYKYELIEYGEDEELYKKGYQFVLMSICSTGKSIRNFLNYRTINETDYISIIPKDSGEVSLKTIPVEANVCKYFIKQTIAHDVHVGKQWDSDVTWQSALRHYIINLREDLKR